MFIAGWYPAKIGKVFIPSQEGVNDKIKIQVFEAPSLHRELTTPLCVL